MDGFDFDLGGGRPISDYESRGASWTMFASSLTTPCRYSVGWMNITAGGVLGSHPAGMRQLFVVTGGSGWVSGADGERREISAGQAVAWESGEMHESGSATGMTALIVQADRLGSQSP